MVDPLEPLDDVLDDRERDLRLGGVVDVPVGTFGGVGVDTKSVVRGGDVVEGGGVGGVADDEVEDVVEEGEEEEEEEEGETSFSPKPLKEVNGAMSS